MKHYYYKSYNGFGNCYELFSVTAGSDAERYLIGKGYERITRRNAEIKCSDERRRRAYDSAFSGFAPSYIVPFDEIDERDYNVCRYQGERITEYQKFLLIEQSLINPYDI